jgi:hypothetical protein
MPALALILGMVTAALVVTVLLVAFLLVLLIDAATMSPHQRLMRERRRHAEQTARAMRRMTRIKARTIRRMDAAERRWRP